MLLDFYSSDCYLSKFGRESHRFSFVTFCTVNGPEFGRLFSACQQAQSSLCSQGPLPCGGQTGRRAFQKINRHLVQICALLSLSSFLSCGRRQLPGPPCPPGTGPIICPLRRVGSLVAPGAGASRLDWLPGSHSPGPSGPDLWHRGPPQEVTGGFHCLGLGYPGAGDADDVFVGRGSEERLGLAILSVPSSWSSGTRGGHVQVPVAGSKAPAPTPSPLSADPVSWRKGGFEVAAPTTPSPGHRTPCKQSPGLQQSAVLVTLLLLASFPPHPRPGTHLGPTIAPCTTSSRYCMPVLWLVSQGAEAQ